MTSTNLTPSSSGQPFNFPRFPAELLLDIFSYADRSTLVTLSLVDLTFLELVIPLIYRTAHIDDLPLPDIPRTPRLAELIPSLAHASVRTLHITPSDEDPPLYQLNLPKLIHLHIHHCCPRYSYTSFSSCEALLSNLDPPRLTFQLRQPSSSRTWANWTCMGEEGWTGWLMSRSRLRELVFRGGSLNDLLRRQGNEAFPNESIRLTIDARRATDEDMYDWSDDHWPREIGAQGMWDVPLRQIRFRTSSTEVKRCVEGDLDDMEDNLAYDVRKNLKPRGTGIDKAGRTFRERIEVILEDDGGPEWDKEEAELDFWRARGRACGPEVEDPTSRWSETSED